MAEDEAFVAEDEAFVAKDDALEGEEDQALEDAYLAEPGVVLLGLVPSPILGTVSTLLNTMLSRFSPPTLTGVTRIR